MYNNFETMVRELGEAKVMNMVNKYQANMDYRKSYTKERRDLGNFLIKEMKAGRLEVGTRVDVTSGKVEG